jgi:hypothetical protein
VNLRLAPLGSDSRRLTADGVSGLILLGRSVILPRRRLRSRNGRVRLRRDVCRWYHGARRRICCAGAGIRLDRNRLVCRHFNGSRRGRRRLDHRCDCDSRTVSSRFDRSGSNDRISHDDDVRCERCLFGRQGWWIDDRVPGMRRIGEREDREADSWDQCELHRPARVKRR